jgi:DNA-binding NarL/FixJ family response regulator
MALIGLLEDDGLMRAALSEALEKAGHRIVFKCETASQFLERASAKHFDLALLDVHLGSALNGIDVGNRLRALYAELPIIFLTSFSDLRLASEGEQEIPLGAKVITKSGIKFFDDLLREIGVPGNSSTQDSNSAPMSLLTNQQVLVLKLIAEGLSNAEIALKTKTSLKNVESIITKLNRALGVEESKSTNSRVQLVRLYFKHRGVVLDG